MKNIESLSANIAPIAKKYGVEKIKLFGSRAKGEEKESSDYDFLISRGEINSLIQYFEFSFIIRFYLPMNHLITKGIIRNARPIS